MSWNSATFPELIQRLSFKCYLAFSLWQHTLNLEPKNITGKNLGIATRQLEYTHVDYKTYTTLRSEKEQKIAYDLNTSFTRRLVGRSGLRVL